MRMLSWFKNWWVERKRKVAASERGKIAEREAMLFLRRRGYSIIARNVRMRLGEIDLVALKGDLVIFVEVKARSSGEFGTAIEGLTPRQRERIRKAAELFLAKRGWSDRDRRFDFVAVEMDKNGRPKHIEHIPGAF